MNAGAYGSDWRAVLLDAVVVGAGGRPHRRPPTSSASPTATRRSRPARSSRRCASGSRPEPPAEIKAEVAELLARRKATQPTTKRTFGSVFKNPDGARAPGA